MTSDIPLDPDPLADLLDTLDLEELGSARITVEGVGDSTDFGESGATVFLASAAAAYVHGTVLPVDGGWLGR